MGIERAGSADDADEANGSDASDHDPLPARPEQPAKALAKHKEREAAEPGEGPSEASADIGAENSGSKRPPVSIEKHGSAADGHASDSSEAEPGRNVAERNEGTVSDKDAKTPYSPLEEWPSYGNFDNLVGEIDARRRSRENANSLNAESRQPEEITPSRPDTDDADARKEQFQRNDKDIEGSVEAVRHLDAHKLRTPAGEAFYRVDDIDMRRLALSLPPEQGKFTADLHGNSESVNVGGRSLTGRDLASFLESENSDWSGEPIRLFSCNTGKGEDPFAQKLADRLGVPVTAPTELGWSDIAGNSWSATKTKNAKGDWVSTWPPDGEWVTFNPLKQSEGAL
jgi:hypothetical protein